MGSLRGYYLEFSQYIMFELYSLPACWPSHVFGGVSFLVCGWRPITPFFSCGIETKISERFNEIKLMWRKSSGYFLLWPYVYCTIVLLFLCGRVDR